MPRKLYINGEFNPSVFPYLAGYYTKPFSANDHNNNVDLTV